MSKALAKFKEKGTNIGKKNTEVPDGNYIAKIIGIKSERDNYDTMDVVKIKMQIVGGEFDSCLIFKNQPVADETTDPVNHEKHAEYIAHDLYEVCGVDFNSIAEINEISQEFIGLRINIQKEKVKKNGRFFDNIHFLEKVDVYDDEVPF